jgi:hypothetical protein
MSDSLNAVSLLGYAERKVVRCIERGRVLRSTISSRSRYAGSSSRIVFRCYEQPKGNNHDVIERCWVFPMIDAGLVQVGTDERLRLTAKGSAQLAEERKAEEAKAAVKREAEAARRAIIEARETEARALEVVALCYHLSERIVGLSEGMAHEAAREMFRLGFHVSPWATEHEELRARIESLRATAVAETVEA